MTRPRAVSKEEVVKNVPDEVERWLEKAIPVINAKLRGYNPSAPYNYVIVYEKALDLRSMTPDNSFRAIGEIKAIYKAQGWRVDHNEGDHCSRDGWFTFS